MLLIIHNLPNDMKCEDIRKLINDKCGITEMILDNLALEAGGLRVTIGLADEMDVAIVLQTLNGVYIHGNRLYIEKVSKRASSPSSQSHNKRYELDQPELHAKPTSSPWGPSNVVYSQTTDHNQFGSQQYNFGASSGDNGYVLQQEYLATNNESAGRNQGAMAGSNLDPKSYGVSRAGWNNPQGSIYQSNNWVQQQYQPSIKSLTSLEQQLIPNIQQVVPDCRSQSFSLNSQSRQALGTKRSYELPSRHYPEPYKRNRQNEPRPNESNGNSQMESNYGNFQTQKSAPDNYSPYNTSVAKFVPHDMTIRDGKFAPHDNRNSVFTRRDNDDRADKYTPHDSRVDRLAPRDSHAGIFPRLFGSVEKFTPRDSSADQYTPHDSRVGKLAPRDSHTGIFSRLFGSAGKLAPRDSSADKYTSHNSRVDKFDPLEGHSGKFAPRDICAGNSATLDGRTGMIAPPDNRAGKFAPRESRSGIFSRLFGRAGKSGPRDSSADKFAPPDSRADKFAPRDSRGGKFVPHDNRESNFKTHDGRASKIAPRNSRADKVEPHDNRKRNFASHEGRDSYAPRDNRARKFEPHDNRESNLKPRYGRSSNLAPRNSRSDNFASRGDNSISRTRQNTERQVDFKSSSQKVNHPPRDSKSVKSLHERNSQSSQRSFNKANPALKTKSNSAEIKKTVETDQYEKKIESMHRSQAAKLIMNQIDNTCEGAKEIYKKNKMTTIQTQNIIRSRIHIILSNTTGNSVQSIHKKYRCRYPINTDLNLLQAVDVKVQSESKKGEGTPKIVPFTDFSEESEDIYKVEPILQAAVDKEVQVIFDLMKEKCLELPITNDTDDIVNSCILNKFQIMRKQINIYLKKRLLDVNTNLFSKINVMGKNSYLKRESLDAFLKDYGVVSLHADSEKMYTATCDTYENYDRLNAVNIAEIDGVTITIKPFLCFASNIKGKKNQNLNKTKVSCDNEKNQNETDESVICIDDEEVFEIDEATNDENAIANNKDQKVEIQLKKEKTEETGKNEVKSESGEGNDDFITNKNDNKDATETRAMKNTEEIGIKNESNNSFVTNNNNIKDEIDVKSNNTEEIGIKNEANNSFVTNNNDIKDEIDVKSNNTEEVGIKNEANNSFVTNNNDIKDEIDVKSKKIEGIDIKNEENNSFVTNNNGNNDIIEIQSKKTEAAIEEVQEFNSQDLQDVDDIDNLIDDDDDDFFIDNSDLEDY